MLRNQLTSTLPAINAALLGSEACDPAQRARIESAFATRVYTWYGQSERVVLAGECEQCETYHHFPTYGMLELMRRDGQACEVGERGEIVGTGFWNRAMPLIRYRTDDSAVREEPYCQCGRNWDRFSDVVGRWNTEGVIARQGNVISAAALNMHGDCFANVSRYQYYQTAVGKVVILVVAAPGFSSGDVESIIAAHRGKTQEEIEYAVERVTQIPLTPSGKQLRVRSALWHRSE